MSEISWRFAGKAVYDAAAFAERLEQRGFEIGPELSMANSFTNLRGRKPSIGKILMRKEDILAIEDHQEAKHSLVIKDGAKTLEFKNLCVVKSQAIWPNIDKEKEETTATTPYLVTIADERYYAPQAGAAGRLGAIEPTGASPYDSLGVEPPEKQIEFLWMLTKLHLNINPTADIANIMIRGSRWDTIWDILDHLGASVRPRKDGDWDAFNYDRTFLGDELNETRNAKPCLTDGAVWLERSALPLEILVRYPEYDYQWYNVIPLAGRPSQVNTAVDIYRLRHNNHKSFSTEDLLRRSLDKELLTKALPWTETDQFAEMWSHVPVFTADNGEFRYGTAAGAWTKERFDSHLEDLAKRYLFRQIALLRDNSWEFIGAWHILPGSRWGSVVYRDTGSGLTTTLVSTELDMNERTGKWEVQKNSFPDLVEVDQQPYGRELYCSVGRPFGLSAGANADCDTILPDQMCHVAAYSGHLTPTVSPNATSVTWQLRRALVAVNATGRPVKVGRFGFAKWNYQIGVGGIWCLVSADGTKWEASCDVKGKETFSIEDPGLIKVNRRAMLRLLDLTKQGCPSPQAIGIDFHEGPPNTVLWTAPDKTIYWTDSPVLKNLTLTESHVKFERGSQESVWLTRAKFTEKAELGHRILLPAIPPRSDAIVIAENTGPSNTTQLGWIGPGLNSEVSVISSYTILENLAEWISNVQQFGSPLAPGDEWPEQTFTFRSGILTESTEDDELPEEKYNPGDSATPGSRFNPCASSPSPGEDPDDPPPSDCEAFVEGTTPGKWNVQFGNINVEYPWAAGEGVLNNTNILDGDLTSVHEAVERAHELHRTGFCEWVAEQEIEGLDGDTFLIRVTLRAGDFVEPIGQGWDMQVRLDVTNGPDNQRFIADVVAYWYILDRRVKFDGRDKSFSLAFHSRQFPSRNIIDYGGVDPGQVGVGNVGDDAVAIGFGNDPPPQ